MPLATFMVTNTNDSGAGSLREAILVANVTPGADRIEFNIPGPGVHTIAPGSQLPVITNPVIIDGYTQPGASPNTSGPFTAGNAVLLIELNGAGLIFGAAGLRLGTSDSTIRGLVINRFISEGITIDGARNVIAGNYIGTDPTGSIDLGNGSDGVSIADFFPTRSGPDNNRVGGIEPADRNFISGNNSSGIVIHTRSGNQVLGNFIGTNAAGDAAVGNAVDGVHLAAASDTTIRGNLISGNGRYGMVVDTRDSVIQGNRIGLSLTGEPLGNGSHGIATSTAGGDKVNNLIGGTEPGQGNIIAFNGASGVALARGSMKILGNSIFGNSQLGIDLGGGDHPGNGVTPNDPGDADAGPNNLQNFPFIASLVRSAGNTTVTGTLNSEAGKRYLIQFFANDNVDASFHGEGQIFLGETTRGPTDGSGNIDFTASLPVAVRENQWVTATATELDPSGNPLNTSEFSRAHLGRQVFLVTNTNNSGAGSLSFAIASANATPNNVGVPDEIHFSIPTSDPGHVYYRNDGVAGRVTLANVTTTTAAGDATIADIDPDWPHSWYTIRPAAALPTITDPVTIDGYTQPGASPNSSGPFHAGNAVLLIELNGAGLIFGAAGLSLNTSNSTIRGLVINRFSHEGITIDGAGNVIAGNYIGTDPTGSIDLGNGFHGVSIADFFPTRSGPDNNRVGGIEPADRNVISGGNSSGVLIFTRSSNQVLGNFIGTNAAGDAAVGNAGSGIDLTAATGTTVRGNLISGNGDHGIRLTTNGVQQDTTNTVIQGNRIGVSVTGGSLPNGAHGIGTGNASGDRVVNNLIGGTDPAEANTIAFNGRSGVALAFGFGTRILGNSIFGNAQLGIDLGGGDIAGNGVTPNDAGDADTGPNNLQNFPVLTSVQTNGSQTTIHGTLDPGAPGPGATFTVQFFANDMPDPSGHGEGQFLLGTADVTPDANGNFTTVLAVGVGANQFVTATGTDAAGNTSEFSAAVEVAAAPTPAIFTVINTLDAGAGSLRQAILDANATPNVAGIPDEIRFNIPAPGVQTIQPGSLPTILDPVVIDGTSQPGFAGRPVIELRGSQFFGVSGLRITAGNSTVRGLVINRFSNGILLETNGGNRIEGNFIGTDVSGTAAQGNLRGIEIVGSSENTIGGTTAAARNVISGNGAGIRMVGSSPTGNRVQGNFIGTDISGTADLGNGSFGILINGPGNTVGGDKPGAGNVISGNNGRGVWIAFPSAAGNIVQGNLIGTDVTGLRALSNSVGGVFVDRAPDTQIGGATPAARNVISGNDHAGVSLQGDSATNALVENNYIGTDATGTAPLANSLGGVESSVPGARILRNLISGNGLHGVSITGTRNVVQGNRIGTDAGGAAALGNSSHGIRVSSSGATIGGAGLGAGNTIAFNGGDGIFVNSGASNAIVGNSIFLNAGLGLDLRANGVTANDLGDVDAGFNNVQNFPLLNRATRSAGKTNVEGTLNSTANATFMLHFYSNDMLDPSGYGEGRTFLGTATITTNAQGDGSFAASLEIDTPAGHFVTATATDATGNTSEFSEGVEVDASADIALTQIDSPDPVPLGEIFTYTLTVTNNGPSRARSVTLTDALPAGLLFISASSTVGSVTEAEGVVTAQLGTMATGSSETVTIQLRSRCVLGVVTNTAHVMAVEPDPSNANNSVSEETTIAAVTFTVNTTDDLDDGVANAAHTSLREAINAANALPGMDRIAFNIPGAGPQTITPAATLPTITQSVLLDATTQPGFAGTPLIELDGTAAGTTANGLHLTGGGSVVVGLAINRFQRSGIIIQTNGGNVIESCYLSTDPTGSVALGNRTGIFIQGAPNNTIGGTAAAARNVISGNTSIDSAGGTGVLISGSEGTDNLVHGNFIGTDITGTRDLGNRLGIDVLNSSNTRIIGNVVSGNETHGIYLNTNGSMVQGNRIGTDVTGTSDLGNSDNGVYIVGGQNNTIGGTTLAARNIISGNDGNGIEIDGTRFFGNRVQGNFIGTDVTGTVALGNSSAGVRVVDARNNTIGGTSTAARNVISGNGVGLTFDYFGATGNLVQGNFIGTDVTGTAGLGNGVGVDIDQSASNNTIGGTMPGAGNTIAFNRHAGVVLGFGGIHIGRPPPVGNAILSNSIFSNFLGPPPSVPSGLGIDLTELGPTLNDSRDGDVGPNNLQNFPVVTSVISAGGSTTVTGTLNSEAGKRYLIQIFANDAPDPSGHGEGQTFRGEITTDPTDGSGNVNFSAVLTEAVADDYWITTTATELDANSHPLSTSEFSVAARVGFVANKPPELNRGIPDQVAVEDEPFSFSIAADTFLDPDGDELMFTAARNDGTPLPGWLSFDAATRFFRGTPANSDVGTVAIRVTATDPESASVSDIFELTLVNTNDAPSFTSAPPTSATEDVLYTYFVTTADPDAGDTGSTRAFSAGKPRWLNLVSHGDGTFTLSGTPRNGDVGTHPVGLRVFDDDGASADQAFEIIVANANDAPSFTSAPLTNATEDRLYLYTIMTADPDPGDTRVITAATSPGWLTLVDVGDGRAGLGGTPGNDDVGTHRVVLRVDDGEAAVVQEFEIIVRNTNDAPELANAIPDQTATAGDLFNFALPNNTFTDPDGDPLTYTATLADGGPLPDWLSFDATAQTFSGSYSPEAGSPFPLRETTVLVTATDNFGSTSSATFKVFVVDTTPPETSITSAPPPVTNSRRANFTFAGTDAVGSVTFETSLDGDPFIAADATQTLFNVPVGQHTLLVRAIDGFGNADPTPATYTWLVTAHPVVTVLQAPTVAVPGQLRTFIAALSDDDTDDAHTATIDWGDGTVEPGVVIETSEVDGTSGTVSYWHTYRTHGNFNVRLTLRDAQANEVVINTLIAVATITYQPDPLDPAKTALVVGGFDGVNDVFLFDPAARGARLTYNGSNAGVFRFNGAIVAYGQSGNDLIRAPSTSNIPVIFFGQAGNDTLVGGPASDILVGGEDHDTLLGYGGRDLLFGGLGADTLYGNGIGLSNGPDDGDLLSSDITSWEHDPTLLASIYTRWNAPTSYGDRLSNLRYAMQPALNSDTVFDDGAVDLLSGGDGLDWFLFFSAKLVDVTEGEEGLGFRLQPTRPL